MPLPSLFSKSNIEPSRTVFELDRDEYETSSYGDGGGHKSSENPRHRQHDRSAYRLQGNLSGMSVKNSSSMQRSGFDEYDAGDDEDKGVAVSKNVVSGMRLAGLDHPRHSPPRSNASSPMSACGDDQHESQEQTAYPKKQPQSYSSKQSFSSAEMSNPSPKRSNSSTLFGLRSRRSTNEVEPPMQISGGTYSGGNSAMPHSSGGIGPGRLASTYSDGTSQAAFGSDIEIGQHSASGNRLKQKMEGFGSNSSVPPASSAFRKQDMSSNQPSGPLDEGEDPGDRSEWGSIPSKRQQQSSEPITPIRLFKSALAFTGLKKDEPEAPITFSGGTYSGGGVAIPGRPSQPTELSKEIKEELESGIYEARPAHRQDLGTAMYTTQQPQQLQQSQGEPPQANLLDIITEEGPSKMTILSKDDDFDDFQAAPVASATLQPMFNHVIPSPLASPVFPILPKPTTSRSKSYSTAPPITPNSFSLASPSSHLQDTLANSNFQIATSSATSSSSSAMEPMQPNRTIPGYNQPPHLMGRTTLLTPSPFPIPHSEPAVPQSPSQSATSPSVSVGDSFGDLWNLSLKSEGTRFPAESSRKDQQNSARPAMFDDKADSADNTWHTNTTKDMSSQSIDWLL